MSDNQEQFFTNLVESSKKQSYTVEEIRLIGKQGKTILPPVTKETASVFPSYFFSGFWVRLFAFLLDLICIAALTQIVRTFIGLFIEFSQMTTWSVYGICGLIVYYGYFILLTKYNHGQTIGKMIAGIRVISLTKPTLDWQTVLIREGCGRFLLSIPVIGYLLYLPILFTGKKQQVADLFCDTSVVTLKVVAAFVHQTSETAEIASAYQVEV